MLVNPHPIFGKGLENGKYFDVSTLRGISGMAFYGRWPPTVIA